MHRSTLRRAALPLATVLGLLATSGAARASIPVALANSAARAQIQPAETLPSSSAVGAVVPAATQLQVTVALTPQNALSLAAYAGAVSTPGSGSYHAYLTVSQFAQTFGATPADAALVRQTLRADGLSVGQLSSNGLALTAIGSAAAVQSAFATTLEQVTLPDGSAAFADITAPSLPATAAGLVTGVTGLSSVPVAAPTDLQPHDAVTDPSQAAETTPSPAVTAAGPAPCASAAADGNTAQKIASAYGLNGLWQAGDLGAGATVALFELEPFSASDVAAYQSCYATHATVTVRTVDQGAGTGSGSGEAALDIDDIAGLAPSAHIEVYEGPDTGQGVIDTYGAIVRDDSAQVVSTSWGLCESHGHGLTSVENTLFEEAATQGQAVFAAAGDSGSDDCGADSGQAVDDPASQPYVTGVGGTSLPSYLSPASETVWDNSYGAGGGGVSTLWTQPGYQSGHVVSQSSIGCPSSTSCREVPDVSADADPVTGYAVYWGGAWRQFGGTSAAAPTWAALTALADSSSYCSGGHVGFVNPTLYALPASDFYDVTQGTNADDGVAGYAAGPGYDMASGLGAPDGAALVPALCGAAAGTMVNEPTVTTPSTGSTTTSTTTATTTSTTATVPAATETTPAVTITSAPVATGPSPEPTTTTTTASTTTTKKSPVPAAVEYVALARRNGRIGQRIDQPLPAYDRSGLTLSYAAVDLPPGLTIDGSGTVGGLPSRTGTFTSSITATDTAGNAASVVVRWRIGARAAPARHQSHGHDALGRQSARRRSRRSRS
jgi:subtilase family serine protease